MILARTRVREDLVFAATGIALGAAISLLGFSRSLALHCPLLAIYSDRASRHPWSLQLSVSGWLVPAGEFSTAGLF
jgi:hypothetical protein